MPKPDLSAMEIPELKDLIAKAEAALAEKVEAKKSSFLADIQRQAQELGLELEEVIGFSGRKKRTPAKPKYQNPDNAEEKWTGKGRAPAWAKPYKDAVPSRLDEILIRG